jgi:hypothetical protein
LARPIDQLRLLLLPDPLADLNYNVLRGVFRVLQQQSVDHLRSGGGRPQDPYLCPKTLKADDSANARWFAGDPSRHLGEFHQVTHFEFVHLRAPVVGQGREMNRRYGSCTGLRSPLDLPCAPEEGVHDKLDIIRVSYFTFGLIFSTGLPPLVWLRPVSVQAKSSVSLTPSRDFQVALRLWPRQGIP